MFSLCMFSSCSSIGNFPTLSCWISRRKDELVSTQEAYRYHAPAVKRPDFVMLPAVRLMFSPSGSPKSRDHVTHYSPHHPGQSHLPSEVSAWNSSNFFPPAQTSLLRDSLNLGSLGGLWLLFGSFICLKVTQDRRRAWTGVLPAPERGEASALLLPSNPGCLCREASHSVVPPIRPS